MSRVVNELTRPHKVPRLVINTAARAKVTFSIPDLISVTQDQEFSTDFLFIQIGNIDDLVDGETVLPGTLLQKVRPANVSPAPPIDCCNE